MSIAFLSFFPHFAHRKNQNLRRRQTYFCRGANTLFAAQVQIAAHLLCHAVHHGQAQASALAGTFRGEASGWVAGGFTLLNIRGGLESVRRTAADVAKDKVHAFFIHRFHRPAIWRVAPGGMPVDLIYEPGDFCVSSTEWPRWR